MRKISLFLLFLPVMLFGQEVNSYLSSKEIFPGQVDTLVITLSTNEENVLLPLLQDTLSKKLEIFGQEEWDTTWVGNSLSFSKRYFISSFDTGFIVVPPIDFKLKDSVCSTFPLLLHVLGEKVDLSQNIKGINDIEEFPITWQEILKYSLWGVGVLVLLLLAYQLVKKVYLNRKSKMQDGSDLVIQRPYMELFWERYEALHELISAEKKWSGNTEKRICSELSELLRSYLEFRYQIPAMENTTVRILQQAKMLVSDYLLVEKVTLVLTFTDQVKFAKGTAMKEDCERLLVDVKSFVQNTIDREENEL